MSESAAVVTKEKKRPHGLLILFCVILFVGVLTWAIPPGEFERIPDPANPDQMVINPHVFITSERSPAGPLAVLLSIPRGFENAAGLIAMILTIGGSIWVFNSTGAISGAIAASARSLGPKRKQVVIVVMTIFFACLGAFPAMFEGVLPFAPIAIAVALMLGYDLIVGLAMPLVGVVVGWTSGVTNLWTVGIGQNMAGLPLFSGAGLRLAFWFTMLIALIIFIVRYCNKIDKDPSKSVVADIPVDESLRNFDVQAIPFQTQHKLIMLVFVVTIGLVVYLSIAEGWSMIRLSTLYISGAIVAGAIARFGPSKIIEIFMAGATAIFPATFAIGMARGISLIMADAGIVESIVFGLSRPLIGLPTIIGIWAMSIIEMIINFFIPSGSGQAMAILPIMLPLGQIVGVSDQITILSFQIGDGAASILYPSVPVLVAFLAYAKVPIGRWWRFYFPLWLILLAIGWAFLAIAVMIGWS
ncbi:MAG: hypothetical protein FWE40_09695 [Oscillospiraceae bacterium]|nr:hypothetical protein [Oscillospiraceae bacterium]